MADELKVSRTTISNAFNRPDQLSADLRERVLATAKRLGYAGPDPVARSLRTRKAGAVGLVMAEPLTYFFSDPAARDFVAGVAQSCEELGQGLLLVAVGASRSLEDGTAAVLGAGVDGFVVYSACNDDPYLEVVLQRRVPVVVVDQPKGLAGVSRVGIDDRAAMRELADYVLGLGHREIGLLTMRLGRERRQGLVDADRLRSPAFDVQRERIVGVWEAMTGQEVARFQGHIDEVTALVFSADGRRIASGSQDATVVVWDGTGLRQASTPLSRTALPRLWDELAGPAAVANRAAWQLAADPGRSVP